MILNCSDPVWEFRLYTFIVKDEAKVFVMSRLPRRVPSYRHDGMATEAMIALSA